MNTSSTPALITGAYKSSMLRALADKARMQLAKGTKDMKYILNLARSYEILAVDTIQTAATDGIYIYFNPEFAKTLSFDDFVFIYLHEVGHPQLFHCAARGRRAVSRYGQRIANEGMDYKVNAMLKKAGLKVPEMALYDERWEGHTMEQVCETIKAERDEEPTGGNPGGTGTEGGDGEPNPYGNPAPGGTGSEPKPGEGGDDIIFGNGNGDMDVEEHQKAVERKAEEAQRIADNIQRIQDNEEKLKQERKSIRAEQDSNGKGSGSIGARLDIQQARDDREVTDWALELRRFVGADDGFDYIDNWAKLRKTYSAGLMQAGRTKKTRPRVGVILDTSGSMGWQLPECLVELEALSMEGFIIDLVTCDGETNHYSYDAGQMDAGEIEINGGGGSDMAPAFKEITDKYDPECLVMITDCGIYWPKEKPEVPLLVLHTPYSRRSHSFSRDSDFPESWFPEYDDEYVVVKKEEL